MLTALVTGSRIAPSEARCVGSMSPVTRMTRSLFKRSIFVGASVQLKSAIDASGTIMPLAARTRSCSIVAKLLRSLYGSSRRTSVKPESSRTRVATTPPIAMRAVVAASAG